MGFLKLLHRGGGQPATETQSAVKKRDKASQGPASSKSAVASDKAANPRLRGAAARDAPPRLDWELRKRPSTQLITLDNLDDAAPWVDVAREADASPSSVSLGFSAALHTTATERRINPRLVRILDEAKLSVAQCSLLVDACSTVIKAQGESIFTNSDVTTDYNSTSGLETLGLFRPWRASESPYAINRALGIFLHLADPDGPAIPLDGIDFISLKQSSTGEDWLVSFRTVLHDLGIHNVVACMKWGLRHLQNSITGGASTNGDAWTWYKAFAEEERQQGYPPSAYKSILFPKFSDDSGDSAALLESVLSLVASVAAHASQNAMTGR